MSKTLVLLVLGLVVLIECRRRQSNFEMVRTTNTGPGLPAGSLYKDVYGSGCPLARWFNSLPKGFAKWETNMLDKYNTSWKAGGSKVGFTENDHNYNTQLGQGNTLGFVAGSLTISNTDVPAKARLGLFHKKATHPVVARFSDFGADGSLQLQRLALKLPWSPAWGGEINLLFTETLSTFPLANYRDVNTFAGEGGIWDKIVSNFHALQMAAGNIGGIISHFKNGDALFKNYYSQTPYAVGNSYAMRFRLTPESGSPEKGIKNNKAAIQTRLASLLCAGPVRFKFQIQLNDEPQSELVQRQVQKSWPQPWIDVGSLTLPKQSLTGCAGVTETKFGSESGLSVDLLNGLQTGLGIADSDTDSLHGLHKAFLFHPVLTSTEHRPIGETNSFRADFYQHHATDRFATIGQNNQPKKIPFSKLRGSIFGLGKQKPATRS